jgi:OPA family glycerol-3-phosphate transporter-like MFS transporter
MSAASLPLPTDDAAFRARRVQNWAVLGLLYAFFYMSRYNFTANNAYLAEQLHWTNTQLGLFGFVQRLVYGLAVVFNGPLADRIGGKKAFLFGAGGVAVANFLFGLTLLLSHDPGTPPGTLKMGMTAGTVLASLVTIWGINGYFQSFGALSIVKVNAQWFHVRERGTFSGVFGVLIRLGLILGNFVTPVILAFLPWNWVFWIPAALVALFLVLTARFVENTPKDAGFGEFDTGDEPAASEGGDEKPATLGFVLRRVFASRATWIIAGASMMIGFVRVSIVDDWFGKYFVNVHGAQAKHLGQFPPFVAAAIGTALAGIAGGFTFGIASDRVFGGRRAPVVTVGFLGMVVMLVVFGIVDRLALGPWAAAVMLILLAFFVNGSHGMVAGAASMDFGGRKAAATAAGLFDGMQYLAGALVGVGVGVVLDTWGWHAWQWAPIPFACIGAALMGSLWNVAPGRRGH